MGCKGGSGRDVPWGTADENYEDADTAVYTLEETGGDTLLVGSAAYHSQAAHAEELLRTLQDVKSPEMLLHAMEKRDRLRTDYSAIADAAEQERLQALMQDVDAAYRQACHDYQLPARSILQTLTHVRTQLENCDNEASYQRIVQARRGYFRLLPQLHRLVSEPGERGRVRRQAAELLEIQEQKAKQFSH